MGTSMKTAVFLQVRLDSSRLPEKALKIIEDKTVIEHAMLSLRNIPLNDYVVVTAEGDQEILAPMAEKCGFTVFAGDRKDVLKRYIDAGRFYTPDIIIRATGDNPLVAWEPAAQLLKFLKESATVDYTAMLGIPVGCGVELFRRESLEKAYPLTDESYDHEHVTPYIYNNPDSFSLYYHKHHPHMTQRVTLDTIEDYNGIQSIFNELYKGKTIPFIKLKDYLNSNDKQ
jgi:spore coat polysaccharide biosynthesis protein SpsF